MKYKSYLFSSYNVNVEVSFLGTTGHAMEYHLMFHVRGKSLNYETQLQNLHCAYSELLKDRLIDGAKPIMKRYFLSDIANQAEKLQEDLKSFPSCTTSILQQPPLDGWCRNSFR